MFSVNNFYDYLTHKYGWPNKNNKNFVYAFNQHGNRNLWNMVALCDEEIHRHKTDNLNHNWLYGRIYLLDQEPLNFELFEIDKSSISKNRIKWFDQEAYDLYTENLSKFKQFIMMLSTINSSIIGHSELNSNEIKLLERHGFISCYYFYHGLISRDWFRHWKHYDMENNNHAQRFGMYSRDCTGTRAYRYNVLNDLLPVSNEVYFEIQPTMQQQITNQQIFLSWNLAKNEHGSDASAIIDPNDCKNFQIQIVLETLFDTEKIHLTEKVFKPMVMKQPFILFAGPGSLKYLRHYGFKTFESLWDESYDNIADSKVRHQKIIELIHTISSLPIDKFNNLLNKAKQIVEHNHRHFYSDKFEQQILEELHQNMSNALEEQNSRELNVNRFKQIDFLYRQTGKILPNTKKDILSILTHLKNTQPAFADQIIKTYPHLFDICI